MPFIRTYKQADAILTDIEKGKCTGSCRKVWTHHIQYAVDTKTNPLKLTNTQKKALTKKIKEFKGKRIPSAKTRKNKST